MFVAKKNKTVKLRKKDFDSIKYYGVISSFFETGCEGMEWFFYEDGRVGYEGLRSIENGDHLLIFEEDGTVIFDDKIVQDREAGWKWRSKKFKIKQPSALGFWIHWTQKGWKPDNWAKLFLRKPHLRAELTKRIPKTK